MRRLTLLLPLVLLSACTAYAPGVTGSGTTVSSASASVPTGWKMYQGEKLGYSLALPSDWKADQTDTSLRYLGGTPPMVMTVFRSTEKFSTLDSALAARDKAAATAWEGQPSLAVKTTAHLTLGSEQVIERREEYLAAGLTAEATYFLHNGQLYAFSSRPDNAEVITEAQAKLHQQIMTTVGWL